MLCYVMISDNYSISEILTLCRSWACNLYVCNWHLKQASHYYLSTEFHLAPTATISDCMYITEKTVKYLYNINVIR